MISDYDETIKRRKTALRQQILSERLSMSAARRDSESLAICDRLLDYISTRSHTTITAFLPTQHEIQLWTLFEHLPDHVDVWVPRALKRDRSGPRMLWAKLPANSTLPPPDWKAGAFGIVEPPPDICVERIEPDLVVTPCVAVSVFGERLGYGGGYYDKFLTDLEDRTLLNLPDHVAVAFSIQIFTTHLPFTKQDYRVKQIMSADGLYPCQNQGQLI
ncbi:MAG: 5-formyltetrahydrofolate cyclo-ligase [Fastidiosipilaceae bacterium]